MVREEAKPGKTRGELREILTAHSSRPHDSVRPGLHAAARSPLPPAGKANALCAAGSLHHRKQRSKVFARRARPTPNTAALCGHRTPCPACNHGAAKRSSAPPRRRHAHGSGGLAAAAAPRIAAFVTPRTQPSNPPPAYRSSNGTSLSFGSHHKHGQCGHAQHKTIAHLHS